MNKKLMSLLLTTSFAASICSPVMAKEIQYTNNNQKSFNVKKSEKLEKVKINQQIKKAIFEQGQSELSEKNVELLLVSDGTDVSTQLKNIGGKVNRVSTSVYLVNIAANNASNISNIEQVKAVGRDKIMKLPKPIDIQKFGDEKSAPIADIKSEYAHESVGTCKLWKEGYDGKGTKIGIIDTGVEPSNEMLMVTTDGKIKIVDYKDFMKKNQPFSESDIKLQEKEVKVDGDKKYIEVDSKKVYIPNTENNKVLFGKFLEEPIYRTKDTVQGEVAIPHDFNNNGSNKDEFSVIVMNYDDSDKANDRIIVDTNLDKSLLDEKEMGIYKDTAKSIVDKVIFETDKDGKIAIEDEKPIVKSEYKSIYDKLVNKFVDEGKGSNHKGAEYNFVITEVENRKLPDNTTQWVVNLGYDGNEHGTHVAGDAAGNGYIELPFVDKELKDKDGNKITDGTIKGAAPGAQIIACRVFESHGGTPQSSYMAAMEYSCENGADVINMSIGSLPDLNDQREPASVLANRLSQKYGAIFCMAAGNEGPATNSINTPGNSDWTICVGGYNPAWLNYGKEDAVLVDRLRKVEDTLWYFSSNGPTEDGKLNPTIIAPGSLISSYPMWYAEQIRGSKEAFLGHGLMQGTSMASPYTAGIIASMKQAITEKNLPYHPLVIKEALFETGNKKINNEVYRLSEIGGGLIDPSLALKYLENLKNNGLKQEQLKKVVEGKNLFIDRNDIVLKTEFSYTEKLDYKPEGLYVRDGDIPAEVDVTIKNTKNIPLNINLSKESYKYSNDWLMLPESNISLDIGQSKTLKLKIDKSKLNQGVNSLIIRMEDPKMLLSEGYIPVTIVNYNDLSVENPKVVEKETREFGIEEVDKHFIRIPYGTESVKVTIQRNDNEDLSLLRPIVVEPSGIESVVYGWDRVKNTDTCEMVLENPTPGTWEIDLYSSRASLTDKYYGKDAAFKAKGKHVVTAEIQGLLFKPSVINYEGTIGEYNEQNVNMKLLNASESGSKSVTIISSGLADENLNKKTERKEIKSGDTEIIELTIPHNNPNIFTKIETQKCEFKLDDIDIKLHTVDENGNIGDVIAASTSPSSNEVIYIESLKPGKYALEIYANSVQPVTHYDFTMQLVNKSDAEQVINIRNSTVNMGREVADIKIGLNNPSKPGKYMGFVYAVDEQGNISGRAKIEAKIQDKEVSKVEITKVDVPSKFKLGSNGKVTIKAKNNTKLKQNVTLIIALYKKETNAFAGYVTDTKCLEVGETGILEKTIKIPNEGEYFAKCFIWDSIEGANPLSEVTNISVEK